MDLSVRPDFQGLPENVSRGFVRLTDNAAAVLLLVSGLGIVISIGGMVIGSWTQSQQLSEQLPPRSDRRGRRRRAAVHCGWCRQLRDEDVPVMPVYGDPYVNQLGDSIARWAVDAAAAAVLYLFHFLSQPTDTIFAVVTPAYNRLLAMSLLLAGGVIAVALMERILGGGRGAGPEVIVRTVAACAAAMVGLPLIRYAVGYADLIATVWNGDVVGGASTLVNQVDPAYHAGSGQAFGSALGLFVAAFLTVLLAVLVHLELVLRAALLALTTTLLPFACIAAIWPRLTGTLTHGRLPGRAPAVQIRSSNGRLSGVRMVVQAYSAGPDATSALLTGLATLTAAVLAPVVLFQGVRFAEAGAAHATRGFVFAAARGTTGGSSTLSRRLRAGRIGSALISRVGRRK